jgi:hypothetical protein
MTESNSEEPSPPSSMPDDWLDVFQHQDVATLDAIARYAQALADARRESETVTESDQTEDHTDEERDALPEEVPTNASIVTKTINGYDYYYW